MRFGLRFPFRASACARAASSAMPKSGTRRGLASFRRLSRTTESYGEIGVPTVVDVYVINKESALLARSRSAT